MPPLEQHTVTDQGHAQLASGSLHDEVSEARKTGNVKPSEKPISALDAFGQFSIGFGQGLVNFTTETVKAAGQAITHPSETINHAIDDTKKAITGATEATVKGAKYVTEKVSSSDIHGMATDAAHTGQAIAKLARLYRSLQPLICKRKGLHLRT